MSTEIIDRVLGTEVKDECVGMHVSLFYGLIQHPDVHCIPAQAVDSAVRVMQGLYPTDNRSEAERHDSALHQLVSVELNRVGSLCVRGVGGECEQYLFIGEGGDGDHEFRLVRYQIEYEEWREQIHYQHILANGNGTVMYPDTYPAALLWKWARKLATPPVDPHAVGTDATAS